jgi:SAM-dependent methyltransferase
VGAAQGELAALLRERGFSVTCLEADPGDAARARERGLDVHEVDLESPTALPPGPFDVVVLGDVLEHLRHPDATLSALAARLAPGGRVVVSVPNVAHLWIRMSLLVGRFEYADRGILDRGHLRFFTLSSFRRLLAQSGLVPIRLVATPVPLDLAVPERYRGRCLRAVQRVQAGVASAWKSMFGYQFVALCARAGDAS